MLRHRYLIVGTLTTESPLHIGSGATTHREGLFYEEAGPGGASKQLVEVNAVAMDHRPKPYIPATSLKGVLRRQLELLRRKDAPKDRIDELLGAADELGGAAEFHDAPAVELKGWQAPDLSDKSAPHPLRWGSGERWTEVAPRVAMDRTTGTASHRRLFHDEYVPAGVCFALTVGLRGDEEDVALLLAALEAFQGDESEPGSALTLGADSGDGWGRLSWELQEIRRLDAAAARRWLESEESSAGWSVLKALSPEEESAMRSRARELHADAQKARRRSSRITLKVRLDFDGLFLVNDPSQTKKGEEHPSHAARLDENGNPILPASSFRGALRSQAERILRTVAGEEAACGPGAPVEPCRPPKTLGEVAELCPACRLFGAAGWRSPLTVSDFTTVKENDTKLTQEFLAIDRFTGGGAPGLKFNARGFVDPQLEGTVSLDLRRLSESGGDTWMLGLLALVLRDLVEGDIRFGFGAGKGFGAAKAEIVEHWRPDWADLPESWREKLEDKGVEEEQLRSGVGERTLDPQTYLGFAIRQCIDELGTLPQAAAGGA